jgi:hypothetical protein
MKTYTIYKKKNRKEQKKTSNAFLKVKMRFFGPEKTLNAVNPVDLVVSFPWPRSTPQSKFPIKSYDRLKLRWSDFDFYFFYLISSLSHLSFYI